MSACGSGPVCRDCSEGFEGDSSPDLERCQTCAEDHQWREGVAFVIGSRPRLGTSVRCTGSHNLINRAPAGRIAEEA